MVGGVHDTRGLVREPIEYGLAVHDTRGLVREPIEYDLAVHDTRGLVREPIEYGLANKEYMTWECKLQVGVVALLWDDYIKALACLHGEFTCVTRSRAANLIQTHPNTEGWEFTLLHHLKL